MNRLVLLGNGFDLAHGLETSYNDFIITYLRHCVESAETSKVYEDTLIKVTATQYFLRTVKDRNKWLDNYLLRYKSSSAPKMRNLFANDGNHSATPFNITVKSDLLKPLLTSYGEARWVDIESEYYDQLVLILRKTDAEKKSSALVILNESLSLLIVKLNEYLLTLPQAPFIEEYKNIITSPIYKDEIYGVDHRLISTLAKDTLILNFNYTNTIEQYIEVNGDNDRIKPMTCNYIHGRIDRENNSIVFGFGDELDSAYKEMEDDSKVRGYFDYIKSFWYLKTRRYRDLVNFIDSDSYQVFVMGHSCGLSDRTMLQMIFEHENCKSVKLFYHEEGESNNFTPLTHEVARHFNDKGSMRKKIVSLRDSIAMPQYNNA